MRMLAGLLLLLAGAAPAAAATPAQLLAKHRPLLVLHPQERFAPAQVEPFLADSDLAGDRYDHRACKAIEGLAALDCYATAAAGYPQAVYGAVHRRGNRLALQYWLFYAYNLWSPTVPQSADFWQAHEGDWELVTVLLDLKGKPLVAGYSRHCDGARRDWGRVPKRGARPLVHVALGSHANYFAAGRYRHEPKCWGKEAVAIYAAYKVPMLDHVAAGRTVSPALVAVSARNPSWMTFRGRFGETQYVHFPNNTFAFGAGPTGPAFHDEWRDPVKAVLAWPTGP